MPRLQINLSRHCTASCVCSSVPPPHAYIHNEENTKLELLWVFVEFGKAHFRFRNFGMAVND